MSKKIPKFKSEDAERRFWADHDSTEYVGWEKAKKAGRKRTLQYLELGLSIIDTEPEEKERQRTLTSHVFYLPMKDKAFHVFDCPGYPDFIGEAIESALSDGGSDVEVVVVDDGSGSIMIANSGNVSIDDGSGSINVRPMRLMGRWWYAERA